MTLLMLAIELMLSIFILSIQHTFEVVVDLACLPMLAVNLL